MVSNVNINRLGCLYRTLRIIHFSTLSRKYSEHIDKTFTIEDDTLDDFTSQLLQKKVDKWSTNKMYTFINKNESLEKCKSHEIKLINIETVNVYFQDAIEFGDNDLIMDLIKRCIESRICPSLSNLIEVLSICSQSGDTTNITEIAKLCEELQPNLLSANSHFKHYLAQAMWVKGNIDTSLKLFMYVYEDNPFIRRRLRLILKYLIDTELLNRGEAAMVNLVKFSEDLVKKYKDFFPLSCIWQTCFLSEWYTDQNLSLELLQRNDGLCKAVISRIPYVVCTSLRSHRTEVVYRLLEVLVKYEMNIQYSGVLVSLLDYQIHQGDVRSCLEIIQWSLKHNVELTPIQNEKFLNILLTWSSADPTTIKEKLSTTKKSKVTPVFKF